MVETNITNLLDGLAVEDSDDLCDFTLADQNEAMAAKGITPVAPSDYIPVIRKTITYIVLAILIDKDDRVLMMQEAKSSYAGKWYLPAGRIEPGEDIEEAVKREVLEETGLEFEPTTLLCIECASRGWFRFILTGNVIGGKLKTPFDADAESLQAKWIHNIDEVELRAGDIRDIINIGRVYYESIKDVKDSKVPWHGHILPIIRPHKKILMRMVVIVKQTNSNKLHILVSEKTEAHLPLCEINHLKNLHSTLRKFMVEIFGADVPLHRLHGIFTIEHTGKPECTNDGLCVSVLVSFKVPLEEVYPIDKYSWVPVNKELADRLLVRSTRNMTIPFHIIR